jgi:ribosome-associated protein
MDYGDFLVHVFDEETRPYYDLEHLWGDAPRVAWGDGGRRPVSD